MQTEYEATFYPIDISQTREKLKAIGATCLKPEYTQIRTTFHFPEGHERAGSFVRVRDEGDRVTMTIKQFIRGGDIHDQKESELIVDSYETAVEFLTILGCRPKSVQETKRELWKKDDIYVMIDQRPFLDPVLEIEGTNEHDVRHAAQELGYDREEAIFDSVTEIYARTYGISHDRINGHTPEIRFDMDNPFL